MSDDITADDITADESINATDITPGGIWPFMPGDRVLCLVPKDGEDGEVSQAMIAGTVERIQIPGPMSPHKVIEVALDEDIPINIPGVRSGWFDPDRLERITNG